VKLNFALLFLLIPSITFSAQLEVGENLLTNFGPEFSDYDNYQPFSMKEHNTYFQLWKSKTRGFSDHYAINKTLKGFKASQDEPADRTCKTHTSSKAKEFLINGYKAITWNSKCVLGELTITSLQLAIIGDDNFYHLRKLWKIPVTNEKVIEWETLLSSTSVCNTTDDKHICPSK
jgi:hypothetical protein